MFPDVLDLCGRRSENTTLRNSMSPPITVDEVRTPSIGILLPAFDDDQYKRPFPKNYFMPVRTRSIADGFDKLQSDDTKFDLPPQDNGLTYTEILRVVSRAA